MLCCFLFYFLNFVLKGGNMSLSYVVCVYVCACTGVSWIKPKEGFGNYHFLITWNSVLWMLWRVAQILGHIELFISLAPGAVDWWLSAESSSGLIHRQAHRDTPAQKQCWACGCPIQQFKGLALGPQTGTTFEGSCQLHRSRRGLLEPSFSTASHFFLLPNLAFIVLGISPNKPATHNSQMDVFPWTWPGTLLLPILLEKCSYFLQFPLFSVFSLCLNSPISAIFNVCFWKQSHMYWLLEVLLARGKSLFFPTNIISFPFFHWFFSSKTQFKLFTTLASHKVNDKPCDTRLSCNISVVNVEIFIQGLNMNIKGEGNKKQQTKTLSPPKMFKQIDLKFFIWKKLF